MTQQVPSSSSSLYRVALAHFAPMIAKAMNNSPHKNVLKTAGTSVFEPAATVTEFWPGGGARAGGGAGGGWTTGAFQSVRVD